MGLTQSVIVKKVLDMSINPIFSKSKFLKALKSSTSYQFGGAVNDNFLESKPESAASIKARQEMGNKIGALAHDYFDSGIEVPEQFKDIPLAEEQTRDLIAAGENTLFEATAINPNNGSFCRIDVLQRVEGRDEWDMIEVKSSTKAKPEHIDDLAFQRYVFEAAGYKIRKSGVLHINSAYVAEVDLDPKQFFTLSDVTDRVEKRLTTIAPKVAEFIAHETGEQAIDKEALTKFLDDVEYPIYFLDYEAVANAIPLYEGTKPYQQVPFQFSLHVQQEPDGELEHISFLHKDRTDPRRAFAEALVSSCGDSGSVVVYYQGFEGARNKELAKDYPDLAAGLKSINERMIDIYEPFKKRWLYDPAQMGGTSIKVVLPTFTNISYEGMDIGNGEQALNEYRAFVAGLINYEAELEALWEGLEIYCEQDTYAMVALLDVLYEKAEYVLDRKCLLYPDAELSVE